MELTYELENILTSKITNPHCGLIERIYKGYDHNSICSKFCISDIKLGNCFIPTYQFPKVRELLPQYLENSDSSNPYLFRAVSPLYYTRTAKRSTGTSILKELLDISMQSRLYKNITNKGVEYYGGPGMILDKDKNPLVLAGFDCTISKEAAICVNNFVWLISPKVFIEKDLIAKTIINGIIPYVTTNSIHYTFADDSIISRDASNCALVRVEPLKKYMAMPVKSKLIDNSNEIWDFLENGYTDLF